MATKPAFKQASQRTQMDVFLGKAEKPLGRLIFVKDGQREFSQFAYSNDWLADAQFFDVSPDLNRQSGYQEVAPAVDRWRDVATSAEVGLQAHEVNDFKHAFKVDIK